MRTIANIFTTGEGRKSKCRSGLFIIILRVSVVIIAIDLLFGYKYHNLILSYEDNGLNKDNLEKKDIIKAKGGKKIMNYKKKLSPEEENVILRKGTESPFSGKYWNFWEEGIYVCKRCGKPLYRSSDKFDSGCGWPSFDGSFPGAVKEVTDADKKRIEIICVNCGAHLGHIFYGEHFTDKNVRHCVNSISIDFQPLPNKREGSIEKAYFAGGCFWGVEYFFQRESGVISTKVGYMGGHKTNPNYKEVCKGDTGHAETVEVTYDCSVTNYEKLAKLFFEIHDPTQLNRQGPDTGIQYRSAIFYVNDEQKEIAENLINELKRKGYNVMTELVKATEFWVAESYHQQYYDKKGSHPYCHRYEKRF